MPGGHSGCHSVLMLSFWPFPFVQRAALELCGSWPACALCFVSWGEWTVPAPLSAPVSITADMTAQDQGMPLSLLRSILIALVRKRTQTGQPHFMMANYLLKMRNGLTSWDLIQCLLADCLSLSWTTLTSKKPYTGLWNSKGTFCLTEMFVTPMYTQ